MLFHSRQQRRQTAFQAGQGRLDKIVLIRCSDSLLTRLLLIVRGGVMRLRSFWCLPSTSRALLIQTPIHNLDKRLFPALISISACAGPWTIMSRPWKGDGEERQQPLRCYGYTRYTAVSIKAAVMRRWPRIYRNVFSIWVTSRRSSENVEMLGCSLDVTCAPRWGTGTSNMLIHVLLNAVIRALFMRALWRAVVYELTIMGELCWC